MESVDDPISVDNEIATQDQTPPHEQVEQEVGEQQEKPVAGPSREHFRRLEQSKKELEKELRMQKEMIERLMQQSQPAPQPVHEVDEIDSIADDDFIPKGKVKALIRKEALKIASEVTKEEQQKFLYQQHQSTFMSRLKGQFSDFDEVVNPETLAILEETNPELAQTIVESKDPYKIGLQSYKFIKAMKLHAQNESPKAKEVEKKLVANAKTVQSPQAFSKRPMAQAFQSSKEDMEALQREMNHYASQAGFSY